MARIGKDWRQDFKITERLRPDSIEERRDQLKKKKSKKQTGSDKLLTQKIIQAFDEDGENVGEEMKFDMDQSEKLEVTLGDIVGDY